jgi:ammonium transporter Rh
MGNKDGEVQTWGSTGELKKTAIAMALFQIALIIGFSIFTKGSDNVAETGLQGYFMFSGVEVMMFVGFGYLMTFMKWYGLSAVGFTMCITAIGLQWVVLTEGFFAQWMALADDEKWQYIDVTIYALLDCLYAVSAVLISFGALIGKVSPMQLFIVTIIELCLHSVNFKVILGGLYVADLGGTYIDHMFGAYFGLACAWVLGKPKSEPVGGQIPDLFSLVGTLFLWIYWPSFVAGADAPNSVSQQNAIVATILALASSTVTAFICSSWLNEKSQFRAVDIQNATLAGGVSIGCVANMRIYPVGALVVGIVAGAVSTYGFNKIQPMLENWGVHDTCGIHNLHAMPSIIGAVASIIVAAANDEKDQEIFSHGGDAKPEEQWWRQLVGMIATFSFSIITGVITGYLCQMFGPSEGSTDDFLDGEWWEVADDYSAEVVKKEEAVAAGETEMVNQA